MAERSNPNENRRCIAATKKGEQCTLYALPGQRFCQMHGGVPVPDGYAKHAMNKTNNADGDKYAAYIPSDLRERYLSHASRDDYMVNRAEIAVLETRITQLMEFIGTGESNSVWQDLKDVWREFMGAVRMGDPVLQNELLPSINRLISQGASQSQQWEEISGMIERRRKLVETEGRQQAIARQMISVDQTIAMLQMVIESVRLTVDKYVEPELAKVIVLEAAETYDSFLGGGDSSKPRYAIVDNGSGQN